MAGALGQGPFTAGGAAAWQAFTNPQTGIMAASQANMDQRSWRFTTVQSTSVFRLVREPYPLPASKIREWTTLQYNFEKRLNIAAVKCSFRRLEE